MCIRDSYTCSYTLTNSYGDSFSISGLVKAIDDDGDYVYDYSCSGIDCKLKNLVNIRKTISVKKFLKKLGVKSYNFYPSDNYVDFVYGSTRFSDETYDTDIVWQINLNSKNPVSYTHLDVYKRQAIYFVLLYLFINKFVFL